MKTFINAILQFIGLLGGPVHKAVLAKIENDIRIAEDSLKMQYRVLEEKLEADKQAALAQIVRQLT